MNAKIITTIILSCTLSSMGMVFPNSFENAERAPGLPELRGYPTYITPDGSRMLLSIWTPTARLHESFWDADTHQWSIPQDMGFDNWDGYAVLSPDLQAMYYANHQYLYVDTDGDPSNDQATNLSGIAYFLSFGGGRVYYEFFDPSFPTYSGDIAYSTYNPNDPVNGFGPPIPLPEINTEYIENFPFVTPDHQVLLFASNRPGGYGGYDIWKATWDDATKQWQNIMPLGPEVNTDVDEFLPCYCPETGILYFCRDIPPVENNYVVMQATSAQEIVRVNSREYNPVTTSLVLEEGKIYTLEVSGTYSIDTSNVYYTDAEWYFNYVPPREYEENDMVGDVIINGAAVNWMGTRDDPATGCSEFLPHVYSPSHVYRYVVIGQGEPLSFKVEDGPDGPRYDDNEGILTVKIMSNPNFSVVSPNGGETYLAGTTQKVRWLSSCEDAEVAIAYSPDYGLTWIKIATTANDGEYEWETPVLTSKKCLIRVYSEAHPCCSDTSDEVFTIYECQMGYEMLGWWGGCDDAGHAGGGYWHDPGSGHIPQTGDGEGQFYGPQGMAFDTAGNIFVTDLGNKRIQKFDSNGTFLTKFGDAGIGQLNNPLDVAVNSVGLVYVVDQYNNRIVVFEPNEVTNDYDYSFHWNYDFYGPYGIAIDSWDNVYVTDHWHFCVKKFDSQGNFILQFGSYGTGDGEFKRPVGVAVDSSGNVFVTDYPNHNVQKFTSNGVFIGKWGGFGSSAGQFNVPYFITVDAKGYVYVADRHNDRVQKFTNNGTFITMWGESGSSDGQFDEPTGVAVDSLGNIYVADNENHRIQKFKQGALPRADFNGDCVVNLIDFAYFASWWLWNGNPFDGWNGRGDVGPCYWGR